MTDCIGRHAYDKKPTLTGGWSRCAQIGICVLSIVLLDGCGRARGPLFEQIGTPRVWPASPAAPRIRFVGVLRGSEDLNAEVSSGESFKAAFRGVRPPIAFSGPHAIAVHANNTWLAVTDVSLAAVHIIDLANRTHTLTRGWSDERFEVPVGAAWAGDELYIVDGGRGEVIALDLNGRHLRHFGQGILKRPVGVTYVPSRDRLYVVDGGGHNIHVFDRAGAETAVIGSRGTDCGQFNFPSHIANDGERLLIADGANARVQLLSLDGGCLASFGQKGDGAGDFSLPKGVAFDSAGHLFVADAHFENIQVFNDAGQLLMAWGEEGSEKGAFSLPAGLAIDGDDRIWVADAGNRRIQVFEYVGAEP